jgi:MoxR-like ATPase
MMKVLVDYPNEQEEFVIVERMTGTLLPVNTVVTTQQLIELQQEADQVYADPALMEYAVRLVSATRQPTEYGLGDIARYILYGCSPRASINLILTARVLAFLRGRSYILAQDIQDMALDVMRHRLVLSYEALSDNVTGDMLLARVMEQIAVPVQPLQEHVLLNVNA